MIPSGKIFKNLPDSSSCRFPEKLKWVFSSFAPIPTEMHWSEAIVRRAEKKEIPNPRSLTG